MRLTIKKTALFILTAVILPLSLISCAKLGLFTKGEKPTEASQLVPAAAEAKADAALGALSKKGKTEAEKKEQELLRETDAETALQELRKREREEHEQAVRRRITEDQIVEKQVQT